MALGKEVIRVIEFLYILQASEVANTALDSLLERKDSDELWDVFIDIKDDNGNALLEPFEIPLSTEVM